MCPEREQTEAARLLERLDADVRHALAVDTRAALERLGFTVRDAEPSSEGADCSVAGSFQKGPPPVITVAADRSHGRRRFTALHEFGHSLIEEDEEIHDLLFEQADRGVRLTEAICDAIAAEILLPLELVSDYISERGPTARGVRDLFRASPASREAVCVRAAQLIRGEGHVMLADNGVARFCASRGSPYRVRRGSPQGADHITVAAQLRGTARGMASVVYGSGATSDRYHVDAFADDDDYVFAVFVADRPAWETEFTTTGVDRTDPVEVECPHCDEQFTTLAAPCQRCGDRVHTECGRCSCPQVRERRCAVCWTSKAVHLFPSPTSEVCVDCGG